MLIYVLDLFDGGGAEAPKPSLESATAFVPLPSKLYKSIVMSIRQGASTMHNDSKQFCFIFQGLRN